MATIPNTIILAHINMAKIKGTFDQQLLTDTGLDWETIKNAKGRSNLNAFGHWLGLHWRAINDESGGFLGQPLKTGTFAMGTHAIISAGNLRRALIRNGQYYRLVSDYMDIQLEEIGHEAHLIFRLTDTFVDDRRVFFDALMVIWLRLSSWLIDRPIVPDRIHLPFELTPYSTEYPAMYGCTVFEHQNDCRIIFAKNYLESKITRSALDLTEFLSHAPENLIIQYKQDHSLAAKVSQLFQAQTDISDIDQQSIADLLAISPSTLRRQLKSEGTSFQALKDQWRRAFAVKLLKTTDQSTQQIATAMGFSEASAFHRAFKKWTGLNPGDFRSG